MNAYPFLRETAAGVTLTVRAQPRAKKSEIVGLHGDTLKVKIAAPPVEDAANDEIIAFFAQLLEIPRKTITIKQGGRSRHKVLEIRGDAVALASKITAQITARSGGK